MSKLDQFQLLIEKFKHEAETREMLERVYNSKICIVDDKIEHLRSMIAGLKSEGYNNICDFDRVVSIRAIIDGGYDLVILDLSDVAAEIDKDDGIGVLRKLKNDDSTLPVFVVTGNQIDPTLAKDVALADMVRYKPVLSADLANDIKSILIGRYDSRLGSLAVIAEIDRVWLDLSENLGLLNRLRLQSKMKTVKSDLKENHKVNLVELERLVNIACKAGPIAVGVGKLAASFL